MRLLCWGVCVMLCVSGSVRVIAGVWSDERASRVWVCTDSLVDVTSSALRARISRRRRCDDFFGVARARAVRVVVVCAQTADRPGQRTPDHPWTPTRRRVSGARWRGDRTSTGA